VERIVLTLRGPRVKKVFLFAVLLMSWFAYEAHVHPYSGVSETQPDEHKAPVFRPAPSIPASSLKDPTLAIAPTLDDPGCKDAENNIRPCNAAEIASSQAWFQSRWNTLPEWLRRKCVSSKTVNSYADCEATETVRFLNLHPGESAPWVTGAKSDAP
jgi:hypothetical protein